MRDSWRWALRGVALLVFVVAGILFALAPSASGGSTNWEVVAPGVTVAQTQDALTPLGFGGLTISVLGTGIKQARSQHHSGQQGGWRPGGSGT